jgi:hypothetical protein
MRVRKANILWSDFVKLHLFTAILRRVLYNFTATRSMHQVTPPHVTSLEALLQCEKQLLEHPEIIK